MAAPERPDLVAFEVLHERAAHGDVDHLLATADAEHRQLTLARLAEHRQLRLVQLRVGVSNLLVSVLSIKGRVDVPAAWQEQSIDVRQRLGPRDHIHGLGAGRLHRPAVGHEILQAAPRMDRDPDSGLGRHELNDQSPAAPAAATTPGSESSASIWASSAAVPWTFGRLNQFLAESNQ